MSNEQARRWEEHRVRRREMKEREIAELVEKPSIDPVEEKERQSRIDAIQAEQRGNTDKENEDVKKFQSTQEIESFLASQYSEEVMTAPFKMTTTLAMEAIIDRRERLEENEHMSEERTAQNPLAARRERLEEEAKRAEEEKNHNPLQTRRDKQKSSQVEQEQEQEEKQGPSLQRGKFSAFHDSEDERFSARQENGERRDGDHFSL